MDLICPDKVSCQNGLLSVILFICCILIVFSAAIHLSAKLFVSLPPSAGWSLKPYYPSECVSLSCLTTESWRTNPLPPQSEWAATLALRTICQQTPVLNPCPLSQRRRGTNHATRSYPYSQQRKVRPEGPGCIQISILGQYKKAFVLNTTEKYFWLKNWVFCKSQKNSLKCFPLLYCYLSCKFLRLNQIFELKRLTCNLLTA